MDGSAEQHTVKAALRIAPFPGLHQTTALLNRTSVGSAAVSVGPAWNGEA